MFRSTVNDWQLLEHRKDCPSWRRQLWVINIAKPSESLEAGLRVPVDMPRCCFLQDTHVKGESSVPTSHFKRSQCSLVSKAVGSNTCQCIAQLVYASLLAPAETKGSPCVTGISDSERRNDRANAMWGGEGGSPLRLATLNYGLHSVSLLNCAGDTKNNGFSIWILTN